MLFSIVCIILGIVSLSLSKGAFLIGLKDMFKFLDAQKTAASVSMNAGHIRDMMMSIKAWSQRYAHMLYWKGQIKENAGNIMKNKLRK